MPNIFIEYVHSLTVKAFDYYSCFISYSTKDDDFARRIHNDLQASGVRCWFAPHDIQGGKKVLHQIEEAIRKYDKLLLILSPDSMNSNWVEQEIINAIQKEQQQQKQVLFPISIVPFEQIKKWKRFDSDSGRDLAREIREYHVPDFSLWRSDQATHKTAFDRLLKDLKQ
ncbi:toll/interleukin-1 receptor domain-containing protein [Chlorobaculum sp. MV4-Y]|uniref:toll/interleukin-1 receptor domain-containing protein n=1 Tax=Chlorobaculum sp. MV4-Y TaxID=2976335 RepID=UPI0021AEFBBB|nr:toll/interleukin-1 receptor domain-containing protein [Chlorobaculum sp. MV4-Y]UWX57200.1 toll/interleukin-1 receptor domain-containing protein [Chlorobaculum sp. MV4-Y]